MSGLGYEYVPIKYDPTVYALPPFATTSEEIAQFGYGRVAGPALVPTLNATRIREDASYRDALSNPSGCATQSYSEVTPPGGRFEEVDSLLDVASSDAIAEAANSDAYQALAGLWSACMTERGFAYRTPTDPLSEFVGQPVDDAQRSTRTADVDCQAEVEWDVTVRDLENEFAAAWLEKNPGVAAEALGAREELLKRAQELRLHAGD